MKNVLFECYSKDLCYPNVQQYWTIDNKCFGMCTITALIVNEFLNFLMICILFDNYNKLSFFLSSMIQ